MINISRFDALYDDVITPFISNGDVSDDTLPTFLDSFISLGLVFYVSSHDVDVQYGDIILAYHMDFVNSNYCPFIFDALHGDISY